jgi:hypothetical protein
MSTIEKTITDGLINPTFDLTIDYAELALDNFLDNDAVKEIPIVKTLVGAIKGGIKIKEIFFAKKLLSFLKQFHDGNIDEKQLNEFKEKYESDTSYRNAIIEQIIIYNERFVDVKKSVIHANLFKAHVLKLIDWKDFLTLSAMLDNLYLESITSLIALSKEKRKYYAAKPALPMETILLVYSGLVVWMHNGDFVLATIFGVYMHIYGIEGNFEMTRDDIIMITPLEVRQ